MVKCIHNLIYEWCDKMVKETQKQAIDRLKKELQIKQDQYFKLYNDMLEMQKKADENFENSIEYKQMKERIDYLEKANKLSKDTNTRLTEKVDNLINKINTTNIQELINEKEHYKKLYDKYFELLEKEQNRTNELESIIKDNDIQKLNNEHKYNERGAGRKPKFTDKERETIKMYRLQGKTIKEIATIYNCSVGLIHKLINEQQKRN